MTDAQFKAFIISALRKQSLRWRPISEVRQDARVARGKYKCAGCGSIVGASYGAVDHINPVVPISGFEGFDSFVNNMFCEKDGLQFLCNNCHDKKTEKENENRKNFKSA